MDTPYRNVVIASLLILFSEVCFTGVSAMIKYLSTDLPQQQLVFFRNLMAFVVLLPWVLRKGTSAFKSQAWRWHISRGIAGIVAMYLYFYSIANLPLAQATVVLLMAPFLIPIISRLWLKEMVSRQTWIAVAVGFIGVTIFLNPTAQVLSPVVLIAFCGAILAAYTKTLIRKMSATESSSKIVFFFAVLATGISAIPLLWTQQSIASEHWLGLTVMGICAVAGQLGMTKAFTLAPAVKVGVFIYSSVIFAALMGYFFWDEALTWHMLVGALVITSAGYLALRNRASA